MPTLPIAPVVVGAKSWFGSQRNSPSDGACGVGQHPCIHPGIDLRGPKGTPVLAPESGTILRVTGNSPPFTGYGPISVLLQGDSGVFHLLSHLDAGPRVSVGQKIAEGAQIGVTSSANHTHWEVRKKALPDFANGETNMDNNLDPVAWFDKQKQSIGVLLAVAALGLGLWALTAKGDHG